MTELRSTDRRKADVLAALKRNADTWIATSDRSGRAHLIAVSAWWDGELIGIATTGPSRTARNLEATRAARLALGTPDDAIMIDVELRDSTPVGSAAPGLAKGFSDAVGWDPAEEGSNWKFFRLRPLRIQAYRGYGEMENRDVLRDGEWLA